MMSNNKSCTYTDGNAYTNTDTNCNAGSDGNTYTETNDNTGTDI